jgi:DNA-binding beta-propeller fold protein YncE
LYPNPAQNNLNVTIENAQANSTISVIDALGKSIFNSTLEGKGRVITNIDLTSVSNGVYFVRVNSGNSVSVQKLIVKH